MKAKALYNKFVDKINAIISDGVVMADEAEDLIWLCKNYLAYNRDPYFDVITSSTQQLGGLFGWDLHGFVETHKILTST